VPDASAHFRFGRPAQLIHEFGFVTVHRLDNYVGRVGLHSRYRGVEERVQ